MARQRWALRCLSRPHQHIEPQWKAVQAATSQSPDSIIPVQTDENYVQLQDPLAAHGLETEESTPSRRMQASWEGTWGTIWSSLNNYHAI